jgi:RNA polymerase sigma-70 factor (ECF subfamily)
MVDSTGASSGRAPDVGLDVTGSSARPSGGQGGRATVDDERLRAFVEGEYRQVVATVELVCGSLPAAEDAVQEAMARAWEKGDGDREIRNLAAWITTVALNLVRSQMRRWRCERRARDRLVPLQHSLPDGPSLGGEAVAVRQALLALPRRQREVTTLRYYLGLDVAEIAEWLGIGDGTVKAMLFRARQSLAVALADDPEPDDQELDDA